MNRRALVIALIVSIVGAALLAIYMRRFEEEASGGEPVKLLVAVKPIEAGAQITDEMLATRAVPRAYVEDRAVLDTERAKVIGLRIGHTVQAQQTLMWTDLAIAMEKGRSLSSLIQPGMRAVTVRTKHHEDSKGFSLIRPGDRIDVIATMPGEKQTDQRSSIVLMQNVLVLAVGLDTGADYTEKPNSQQPQDLVLSLSLTVPEAQLLALATEKGTLLVALRNPDDVRVTEGMSDLNSSALSDTKRRGEVQNARRSGPVKIESGAQQ